MHERHGLIHTAEYRCWDGIKQRCHNPKNKAFKWYGARGIRVCSKWMKSFLSFYQDVGKRPSPNYSLDRIKNDKGYAPGNVRWATAKQQRENQRERKSIETFSNRTFLTEFNRRWPDEFRRLNLRMLTGENNACKQQSERI